MIIESKKWPSVIGSQSFIDWAKGQYYALKTQGDIPDAKSLAPSIESIIEQVYQVYDIAPDDLYRYRRGVCNEPRNVAIYLFRVLRRDPLKNIARQFQMKKYSSVGSTLERLNHQKSIIAILNQRIERLMNLIIKNQNQPFALPDPCRMTTTLKLRISVF